MLTSIMWFVIDRFGGTRIAKAMEKAMQDGAFLWEVYGYDVSNAELLEMTWGWYRIIG